MRWFPAVYYLVATVIGIGAAIMIRDAVQSRSVMIDPFDIAPNVATEMRQDRRGWIA